MGREVETGSLWCSRSIIGWVSDSPGYQYMNGFANPRNSGGVRGIIELEILKQIEVALGGRVNILSFFDLVVGTRYAISD